VPGACWDGCVLHRGQEVEVLEMVRMEGSAVPSLLDWGSETGALERVVERRAGLGIPWR
jgi:hypothetical protein